jgi:hypothetical protein
MDTFDKDVLDPIRLDEGEEDQFGIPGVDGDVDADDDEKKKEGVEEDEEPEIGAIDDPDGGLLDDDLGSDEEGF